MKSVQLLLWQQAAQAADAVLQQSLQISSTQRGVICQLSPAQLSPVLRLGCSWVYVGAELSSWVVFLGQNNTK